MNSNNNSSTLLPTTTANSVYETFKDAGVVPSLVALIGCKSLVCLVGVLLNANLVYVTLRTKTLRGTCNLQIALSALSIVVQECSSLVTLAVVVSGICALIQFLPLFCTIFTNGIAFSIGIDRLLSVLYPIWYIGRDKKRSYLYIIIAICTAYASFVPIVSLNNSLHSPTIPVMCTVIDPAQSAATWIVIMLLSVNCSSVCCYILVWLVISCRQNMLKKQMNVFKSLSMILLLELFGWVIVNISTIAPYLSMSVSPAVLYIFSSEYRRAFILQFPSKFTVQIHRPLTEMSKRRIGI